MRSLAIWIACSGWIGDRFGTELSFLFVLALFTLALALYGAREPSVSCGVWHLAKGGGGNLVPVGTAMLYRASPPQERAVLIIATVRGAYMGRR